MNKRSNRITTFGSRKFYSLLLTSSIGMIISSILLLTDTIIAGQFFGETGIAAVNLVSPIISITLFLQLLVEIGTLNTYSLEMGKFNQKRANEFFGQGVILSVIIGILLFAFTLFGKDLYLSLINPSEVLLQQATEYYKPYPYLVLLYPITWYFIDIVYIDGDEQISNLSYSIQIIGNVIGSLLFCKHFGIAGIAYGTLFGQVLAMLVALFHFLRKQNSLHFIPYLSLKDTLHVIKYGITDGTYALCSALIVFILNTYVTARFGEKYLVIATIIINLRKLAFIFSGVGQAFTPLVNVYLGEKNDDSVRDIMKSANKVALIEGFVFSIILILFAPVILKIYGVNANEMSANQIVAIRIAASSFIFLAIMFEYSSYYILRGEQTISVVMVLLNELAVPLFVGFPLSMGIGINGLWIGMAAGPIISLLVGAILVLSLRGKDRFPLLLDPKNDHTTANFDVVLSTEAIIELRNNIEKHLRDRFISQAQVTRVMLTVEECCLLILEHNKGKTVYLQCTIFCGDQNRIILRDSGKVFDLTNEDLELVSINAYLMGILMSKHRQKHNLTTLGCNRNEFIF